MDEGDFLNAWVTAIVNGWHIEEEQAKLSYESQEKGGNI
uniref:Uncharacterized protein n=1 Tax=viral metagenome TaxID=1070528 RepID=A0A6C0E1E5_9ZZZZ